MEIDGTAHHGEGDQRAHGLQATERRQDTNQEQCRGEQLGCADDVLAEQARLSKQAIGAETGGPVIQLAKDRLGLGCIGELEAQTVQKDERGDAGNRMRRDGFGFGDQPRGVCL